MDESTLYPSARIPSWTAPRFRMATVALAAALPGGALLSPDPVQARATEASMGVQPSPVETWIGAAQARDTVPIAQAAEGETQELVLKDGSKMFGRVMAVDGDSVRFQLLSGQELTFQRSRIDGVKTARGSVVQGRFMRHDPHRTRLFFAPTARARPAGGGDFTMISFVMPFLAVSPTDWLTVSGGTPLIFGDADDRPYWLAAKATVAGNGKVDGAVGALTYQVEEDNGGIFFGVITAGDERAGVTVGAGFGWVNGSVADRPALMLGGESRLSDSFKLITENYLFPGDGGLISLGPRFMGEHLSADLALTMPVGFDDTFVLPLVNFAWSW